MLSNLFELAKGAVTQDECDAIGRSRTFHIDREYMSDAGCIARICLFGTTLEVYGPPKGNYRKESFKWPRLSIAMTLALVVALPSPLWDEGKVEVTAAGIVTLVHGGLGFVLTAM